jgi:hypothetical protein
VLPINQEAASSLRVQRTADSYTLRPLSLLFPISVTITTLLIFEPGGPLGSPQFWLALLLMAASAMVWIIEALVSLMRRRWRLGLSIIFAGAASFFVFVTGIFFEDQIHFNIMLPIYAYEAAYSSHSNRIDWLWRGGLGYDKRLVFDRAGIDLSDHAPAEQSVDNYCTQYTSRMLEHFYLVETIC